MVFSFTSPFTVKQNIGSGFAFRTMRVYNRPFSQRMELTCYCVQCRIRYNIYYLCNNWWLYRLVNIRDLNLLCLHFAFTLGGGQLFFFTGLIDQLFAVSFLVCTVSMRIVLLLCAVCSLSASVLVWWYFIEFIDLSCTFTVNKVINAECDQSKVHDYPPLWLPSWYASLHRMDYCSMV